MDFDGAALRKELAKMHIGVVWGCPPNCSRSTNQISVGLSSKMLASAVGLTMEEVMPDGYGKA